MCLNAHSSRIKSINLHTQGRLMFFIIILRTAAKYVYIGPSIQADRCQCQNFKKNGKQKIESKNFRTHWFAAEAKLWCNFFLLSTGSRVQELFGSCEIINIMLLTGWEWKRNGSKFEPMQTQCTLRKNLARFCALSFCGQTFHAFIPLYKDMRCWRNFALNVSKTKLKKSYFIQHLNRLVDMNETVPHHNIDSSHQLRLYTRARF